MIEKWIQLENWIVSQLKEVDSFIKRTPGSGNGACKGDIKFSTNLGLHIEAKYRNTKSVYNEDWLEKAEMEIPLHVNKAAVLFTMNKVGKVRVHMDAKDFMDIFKRSLEAYGRS
jgi:hypothetical protein